MSPTRSKSSSLNRGATSSSSTIAITPAENIREQHLTESMNPANLHLTPLTSKRPNDDHATQKKRKKKRRKPYIHQGVTAKNELTRALNDDLEEHNGPNGHAKTQSVISSSSKVGSAERRGTSWDDLEIGLIDIDQIHNTPKPSGNTHAQSEPIEGLIDLSDSDQSMSHESELVDMLAGKDIMNAIQDHKASRVDEVKRTFKSLNIPPTIKLRRELMCRADKHMHAIPRILRGELRSSNFYELAKRQCESSSSSTLSASEKIDFNWRPYFGGYIGFKRQLIIGQIIANRCKKDLMKASTRNRTVSYWTAANFATYVLANEIIIRMTMEDMHCSFDKAERIVMTTKDYGIYVTDLEPIANDVDSSELLREAVFCPDEKHSTEMLDDLLNGHMNSSLDSN